MDTNDVFGRINAGLIANEKILQAALEKARADLNHNGLKGGRVESAVRSVMRAMLPQRYLVASGEVIDQFGARSRQSDALVLDPEQPFTFEEGEDGVYIVEGVSAICEIKSVLTTGELEDCIEKGRVAKRLRTGHVEGTVINTNREDLARFYTRPPFFVLAIETDIAQGTLEERLPDGEASEWVEVVDGEPLPVTIYPIDALFVLGKYSFINLGAGGGGLKVVSDSGESSGGWHGGPSAKVLVELALWLHSVMPRYVRTRSIAIPYLR